MSGIIAYACSKKPNHLWSAAQYNSALEKNRVDCDIPLVALSEHATLSTRISELEGENERLRDLISRNWCGQYWRGVSYQEADEVRAALASRRGA